MICENPNCGRKYERRRPHQRYCSDRCRLAVFKKRREARGERVSGGLSQRDRVFHELAEAGSLGVRSDRFLEMGIPRAAARVKELREAGHEIESRRESQFVRYVLVGVGSEDQEERRTVEVDLAAPSAESGNRVLDADSGETSSGVSSSLAPEEPPASLFEVEVKKKKPRSAQTDSEWGEAA